MPIIEVELLPRSSSSRETKPHSTGSTTVGIAVAVPVAVFLLIIAFFIYKNWKKNKKESLDDDNPDFVGQDTQLPDYSVDAQEMVNQYGDHKYPHGGVGGAARKPNLYSQFQDSNISLPQTVRDSKMDSFILPYSEQTHSKKSLDQFAQSLVSDPLTYPRGSRSYSEKRRVGSNLSTPVNLAFSDSSESRSFQEKEETEKDSDVSFPAQSSPKRSQSGGSIDFQDMSLQEGSSSSQHSPVRRNSVMSFENSEEELHTSERVSGEFSNTSEQDLPERSMEQLSQEVSHNSPEHFDNLDHHDISSDHSNNSPQLSENSLEQNFPGPSFHSAEHISLAEIEPIDMDLTLGPQARNSVTPSLAQSEASYVPSPEEEEQIKRMRSVYKVYFERENSVKAKKQREAQEAAPPLPNFPRPHLKINTAPRNPLPPPPPRKLPKQRGVPLRPLESLPSPHEINQRPQSSVNTWDSFQPNRKFSDKQHSSGSPRLENGGIDPFQYAEMWSPAENENTPSPHHLRNSVVMVNPTGIPKGKTFRPAGSFAKRNFSSNSGSPVTEYPPSPNVSVTGHFDDKPPSPHGAHNLVPRSGSQSDLRRQMGHANV